MFIFLFSSFRIIDNINVQEFIKQQLQIIEKDKNVIIIYAADTGSRAWNLHSPTSDYDIKFIYRNLNVLDYIHACGGQPETISHVTDDKMFEFHGWNLDKAFLHLGQGNCSLFEWMHSSIVYRGQLSTEYNNGFSISLGQYNNNFATVVKQIYNNPKILNLLIMSYRGQCISQYKQYLAKGFSNDILVKKYINFIRPMLMYRYIAMIQDPILVPESVLLPTKLAQNSLDNFVLDINVVVENLKLNNYLKPEIYDCILNLINLKKTNTQNPQITKFIHLWISDEIPKIIEFKPNIKNDDTIRKLANDLFCKMFLELLDPILSDKRSLQDPILSDKRSTE